LPAPEPLRSRREGRHDRYRKSDISAVTLAVVVPCYRVKRQIKDVLSRMGPEVCHIFVVDDCCPEHSGHYVEQEVIDSRVRVIYMPVNSGVGGAVKAGYQAAISAGADIIVKIDGDGQMDPTIIPQFVEPIVHGRADYTKGNRFYDIETTKSMPFSRLLGNAILSFAAKASTGYWNLFDPNNGYTAIHAGVARLLPFEKIDDHYFFETDMLFRLNTIQATVAEVPMSSVYADETSNLIISKEIFKFASGHFRNLFKRLFYNYFLRGFSAASVELASGIALVFFGCAVGLAAWIRSISSGIPATAGTVMLAAMPIIVGIQLLLNFLSYDMSQAPNMPAHLRLGLPAATNTGSKSRRGVRHR
jgi:dolichol-phosphate mannosyltransferase